MTPAQFVDGRPCLEEIDGYLRRADFSVAPQDPALQPLVQAAKDMRLNAPAPGQVAIDADGLKLIEVWRRKLLKGKGMPADTSLARRYEYKRNQKPKEITRRKS